MINIKSLWKQDKVFSLPAWPPLCWRARFIENISINVRRRERPARPPAQVELMSRLFETPRFYSAKYFLRDVTPGWKIPLAKSNFPPRCGRDVFQRISLAWSTRWTPWATTESIFNENFLISRLFFTTFWYI